MNNKASTIVHLADASPSTVALINRLAERGWIVHLISHKIPPTGSLDIRVKVHRLPVPTRYPLTYLAFLAAAPIIRSIKPDIVHAHYLTSFGIMAAVYRRFLRFKPMILTACGDDVLVDSRGGMTRWSAEHALKMFEVVTCSSKDIAKGLQALEAPADRIEQIDWSNGASEAAESAAFRLDQIYTDMIRRYGKKPKAS
jgi:hypothetical protein